MAICSRNYSLCCTVISAWGIIQLVVMGVLFYYKAVAFSEDLQIEIHPNDHRTMDQFYADANQKYEYTANNCWVAAAIYLVTFFFSLQQFYASRK